MSASSLQAGIMMLTRGVWFGRRSHSRRAMSAIFGIPRAASTIRENQASARIPPTIQWIQIIVHARARRSLANSLLHPDGSVWAGVLRLRLFFARRRGGCAQDGKTDWASEKPLGIHSLCSRVLGTGHGRRKSHSIKQYGRGECRRHDRADEARLQRRTI